MRRRLQERFSRQAKSGRREPNDRGRKFPAAEPASAHRDRPSVRREAQRASALTRRVEVLKNPMRFGEGLRMRTHPGGRGSIGSARQARARRPGRNLADAVLYPHDSELKLALANEREWANAMSHDVELESDIAYFNSREWAMRIFATVQERFDRRLAHPTTQTRCAFCNCSSFSGTRTPGHSRAATREPSRLYKARREAYSI